MRELENQCMCPPRDWDGFLNTAGNPNIPTIGEAMRATLTAAEQDRGERREESSGSESRTTQEPVYPEAKA